MQGIGLVIGVLYAATLKVKKLLKINIYIYLNMK